MNQQILRGHWKELKGQIKTQWGKMTDDEIDKIEGNYDQLVGRLQKKYGYELEESRDKVNAFLKKWNDHFTHDSH